MLRSSLSCFISNADIEIPPSVSRSTTADIVLRSTTVDDVSAKNFSKYRRSERHINARSAWQQARMAFELASQQAAAPVNFATLRRDFFAQSVAYRESLLEMAKNGIWNCGEFADFALIEVDRLGVLSPNNVAKVVTLNNPQIPEADYGRNHDHAFVLILDRQSNPQFVIDLWQKLVTGTAFVGSVEDYIRMLGSNPDGRYVRPGVVSGHIRQICDSSLVRAGGEADEPGYHRPLLLSGGVTRTAQELANRTDIESVLQGRRGPHY